MFLVDTNVWLERLLEQENSDLVKTLLEQVPSENLSITDFTYHSIGLILANLNQIDAFHRFTLDTFIDGDVGLIHLKPENSHQLIDTLTEFKLDFDDAYQYLSAELNHLTIISFDKDFDRTKLGRKTPAQILRQLKQ